MFCIILRQSLGIHAVHICIFGLVAQLGERTVRIRKVEGSIPFESTRKYPSF